MQSRSRAQSPRMTRLLAVLAVIPVMALGACASTGNSPEPAASNTAPTGDSPATVRIAIANTGTMLPILVADQQGFFDDHNIDIEITTLADISKIPPALGNQFDIGMGVQPIFIKAATAGLKIVQVSEGAISSKETPAMVLMAKSDAGITSPKDFVGKRIGTPVPTGNIHLGVQNWLSQNGVDLKSFSTVQVATPNMIDQLKQGLIDVGEVIVPFNTVAEKAGLVKVGYGMDAVADPVGFTSWISSRDWADKNKQTIVDFRAALGDAQKWIKENDAAAKKMVAEYTKIDQAIVDSAPLSNWSNENTVGDLEAWIPVLKTVTNFTTNIKLDDLIAYPTDK